MLGRGQRSHVKGNSKLSLKLSVTNTGSSSSKKGIASELRCYKHSPRVQSSKHRQFTIEMHDYEATQWSEAFSTMGRLQKLGLKEATPFTTLNKAPYHCLSLSRHYAVSYGKMSQVPGASVKGAVKKRKEVKLSACNCIEPYLLPKTWEPLKEDTLPRRLLDGSPRVIRFYVPRSCVVVRWNEKRYTGEGICEWLMNFGPFFCTIYKGTNALLVFFESIQSAYKAVNCPLANTGIAITWYDIGNYNFGHYTQYKNYNMSSDSKWQKLLNRQKKGALRKQSKSPVAGLKFQTQSVNNKHGKQNNDFLSSHPQSH